MTKPPDVSTPLPTYTPRAAGRRLSLDLLAGEEAMRSATYLPPWPGEKNTAGGNAEDGYQRRLKAARLEPDYSDAVKDLAARPFSRLLSLGDDVPASDGSTTRIRTAGDKGEFLGHQEDIDNRGNSLHVFAGNFFEMTLGEGAGAIFVDHTPRRVKGNTKEADRLDGGRPYWIAVPDSELLDGPAIWTKDRAGKQVPERVRRGPIKVWVKDDLATFPGGHEETLLFSYFRGDPAAPAKSDARFAYYRKWRKDEKDEWVEVPALDGEDRYLRPHTEIPISFLSLGENATPPLGELAKLCRTNYRKTSNSDEYIERTAFMLLTATGVSKEEVEQNFRVMGHAFLWHASHTEAKLGKIEPEGGAWDAIRQDRQDLKLQIREAALRPLVIERTGGLTATEVAVSEAKSRSRLEYWVGKLEDCLNGALKFHAAYLGEQDGGRCKATREFGVTAIMAGDMAKLVLEMMGPGPHLTRETGLKELQLRGILSERVDPEEEARRVDEAKPPGLTVEDDERVNGLEERMRKMEGAGREPEGQGGAEGNTQ